MSRDMTKNGACAVELAFFLIWMESNYFAVNAYVLLAAANFQHGFITEGDGIKYAFPNGTDIF